MKTTKASLTSLALVCFLSACASPTTPQPATESSSRPMVIYSTLYANGSQLKETPTEVRIVGRQTTGKYLGTQVLLNVAMLALGGVIGVQGFSKDDLHGDKIKDVKNRDHLQNPIPQGFVLRMQKAIDAAVQADPVFSQQGITKPIVIGGGSARLVYESLAGEGEATYRLRTHLDVYKLKENASLWANRPTVIDCNHASPEPLTQAQWAANDYVLVGKALANALDACETKTLAQLASLME